MQPASLIEALVPPGDNRLQAIDPRLRVVITVAFSVVCVTLSSLWALMLALGLAVTLAAFVRLPLRPTAKKVAAMDGFILFLLISLPFTVPGSAMFTLAGLPASREGALLAAQIALKANAVILTVLALIGTLPPVTLGHALYGLRLPAGLVHLLLFTLRYIGVLRDEYARLRLAMRARAFRPTNSWHTYRSYGYLVGMMLVRALDRSERIMEAMKCRGFDGNLHVMARFRLTPVDAVCALAALVGLALLGMLDWWARAAGPV